MAADPSESYSLLEREPGVAAEMEARLRQARLQFARDRTSHAGPSPQPPGPQQD